MTEEGSLYTWGDGAAQNLGYADALRQVIPRRVDFHSAQHVLQVCPCGRCDPTSVPCALSCKNLVYTQTSPSHQEQALCVLIDVGDVLC